MSKKILSTPPGNYPRASILSQNEVDVNVNFARKFERSPQPNPLADGRVSPELSQMSRGKISQDLRRRKAEEFAFQKHQKPQISSIPGTSPKQRDRYRVVLGDEILGERLDIDQALKLAKGAQ